MSASVALEKRVAAFFDIDGTLIPPPSLERRFFASLRRAHAIPLLNYLRWCSAAVRLMPRGLHAVQHANKFYLYGVRSDLIYQHVESIAFFEEGVERVAWHARQGHAVVLLSGTLEPLAQLVATALGCELEARGVVNHLSVCATRLKDKSGRWTGELKGPAMYGPAKFDAILEMGRVKGIDLFRSYAYGDSLLDQRMFAAVGHPQVVNPGKELAETAGLCNWPIWHWYHEKKIAPFEQSCAEIEIQPVESQS